MVNLSLATFARLQTYLPISTRFSGSTAVTAEFSTPDVLVVVISPVTYTHPTDIVDSEYSESFIQVLT